MQVSVLSIYTGDRVWDSFFAARQLPREYSKAIFHVILLPGSAICIRDRIQISVRDARIIEGCFFVVP